VVGKSRTHVWRWLKAAEVFQKLTSKQIAEKHKYSITSAHKAIRMEYKRNLATLKAIDRSAELSLCKECGIIFKPAIGFQEFCSPNCRTKSYLKLNREVIAEKTKKKSELFRKSHAESLYATKKPKCDFCQNQIPFSRFFKMNSVKYCSKKCSRTAFSENRKNDPYKAEAYKIIRKKTYLKRQLNGKNARDKREYYQNNIQARIAKNLRTWLRAAIKKQGGKKFTSTMKLLGTDWPTFSTWIEKQFEQSMTWSNYGLWHIHHKIPCAAFDLTKPEHQKMCFHYRNLQPMWGIENIKRGAKFFPTQMALRF
jgi:hypothetical protein